MENDSVLVSWGNVIVEVVGAYKINFTGRSATFFECFFGINSINEISTIFYFTEPASYFFANLIFFHDEVCLYIIWILIFTYRILIDILDFYEYEHKVMGDLYIGTDNNEEEEENDAIMDLLHLRDWLLLMRVETMLAVLYEQLKYISSFNKLDDLYGKMGLCKKVWKFVQIKYYQWFLKYLMLISNFFFFSVVGFSSDMSLSRYNFFIDNNGKNFKKKYVYDTQKFFMFSNKNINILSIEGKLIEVFDFYSLSHLLRAHNLIKIRRAIKKYLRGVFSKNRSRLNFFLLPKMDKKNKKFFKIKKKSLNFYAKYSMSKYFTSIHFDKNMAEHFYEIFSEFQGNNSIYSSAFSFQKTIYYKKRLLQISSFFNPYFEVFSDIFSLNTSLVFTHKDKGNYKWWEFNYVFLMIKNIKYYANMNSLKASMNRDIIIHAWEYNHSIKFEYIWALFPTYVIASIIGPSFVLLYSTTSLHDAFLTVKIIGHQWYWSYETINFFLNDITNANRKVKIESHYIDNIGIGYKKRKKIPYYVCENHPLINPVEFAREYVTLLTIPHYGCPRLLWTTKRLTLIAHQPINFLITSGDVLHSFAVPAMGIKVDAVPGRINTFYLKSSRIGLFYGQCSELCGFGHGFMPIVIDVVLPDRSE